ncbi:MAG: hypothetical protein KAJ33_02805 [Thermoplasmata archaeon]|nr:hypothetical protein [Thermoplasmata archaeon]
MVKKKIQYQLPTDVENIMKIYDNIRPTLEFMRNAQQMYDTYQQIAQTNFKIIQDIERWGEVSDKYSMYMLQFNWPPPMDMAASSVPLIVNRIEKEGEAIKEELENAFIELYDERLLNEKLIEWKRKKWIKARIPIIESVIAAHIEGNYNLSIPTLLPQIEGAIYDGYGYKGWVTYEKFKKYSNGIISTGTHSESLRVALSEYIIKTLLVQFEYGKQVNSSLSRHAILHGGDTSYGSSVNSLKLILLFDYIVNSFRIVSIVGTKKYHLMGCHYIDKSSRRKFYLNSKMASNDNKEPCKLCNPDK